MQKFELFFFYRCCFFLLLWSLVTKACRPFAMECSFITTQCQAARASESSFWRAMLVLVRARCSPNSPLLGAAPLCRKASTTPLSVNLCFVFRNSQQHLSISKLLRTQTCFDASCMLYRRRRRRLYLNEGRLVGRFSAMSDGSGRRSTLLRGDSVKQCSNLLAICSAPHALVR